ncbi:MAG: histidine--tRNA ligase [Peptostreptococcaceae bacterium]|nr:histidine--tRNA ligase [Peptostreptococcaceae bacterium]
MAIKAQKGTKDIFPDQIYKWHYIEKSFADICDRYGFKEARTPVFEATELFQRGVGDTTDIVQKEMYTFEDYGGRSITLKPEGTSPTARAFLELNHYADAQPSKYYYSIPCFRYEKPQSGRLREFHQFGIETFGTDNMIADAEIIALGYDFLHEMGVGEIELRINSVGCPKCRPKHREALTEFLKPRYDELCDTCKVRYETNPMRILDCKSEICQDIVKDAPMMIDYLCDECVDAFEQLKKDLDAFGIKYTVDPRIVRGLDYYTKTAFEFVTTKIGAQGTVCGGGRYDYLMDEIGDRHVPGVGFGLGKERLIMLMEANGVKFPEPKPTDVFIAYVGEEAKLYSLNLLRKLRNEGLRAEIDALARNIKGQFKYANRLNAKYTVVIGDSEIESGVLTVKDMANSNQFEVKREELIDVLKK